MNKLTIIGNLTRDPELRTTQSGLSVCSFTVAVNRRRSQNNETDYFRVTVWRELAEICQKYLAKGRKVAVCGPVAVSTYTANDGSTRATLEVTADEVEFLTPREDAPYPAHSAPKPAAPTQPDPGFEEVDDNDLPF